MEPLGTTLLSLSWPIYLAVTVLLLAVWTVVRRLQRSPIIEKNDAVSNTNPLHNASALVYTDAPTVRLGDVQRMDRLHRVVSLKAGEHVDLLEPTFDRIPRLRIALAGIEHIAAEHSAASQECARIQVELGGAVAGCGSLVKEVGNNQFLVPCATQDEQRSSILHFDGKGDAVGFLRIKVLRMNTTGQSVDVDVLHVCGQWAA